jgi:hypothetical protein
LSLETVTVTAPDPTAELPAEITAHDAGLAAFHEHPLVVATVTETVPPVAGTLADVADNV